MRMGEISFSISKSLTSREVSLRLRLKLFDTAVTPTVLYSLDTCPLTQRNADRLNTAQRKMRRAIVGWPPHLLNASWEDIGHRMKERMLYAQSIFPMPEWNQSVVNRKRKLLASFHLGNLPVLTMQALKWSPPRCNALNGSHAHRSIGHPHTRWDDI